MRMRILYSGSIATFVLGTAACGGLIAPTPDGQEPAPPIAAEPVPPAAPVSPTSLPLLVGFTRSTEGVRELVALRPAADGWERETLASGPQLQSVSWNPSGDALLYTVRDDANVLGEVLLRRLVEGQWQEPVSLLADMIDYPIPTWSRDGSRLLLQQQLAERATLFKLQPGGGVAVTAAEKTWASLSPLGTHAAFSSKGALQLSLLDTDQTWKVPIGEVGVQAFSADGTWFAAQTRGPTRVVRVHPGAEPLTLIGERQTKQAWAPSMSRLGYVAEVASVEHVFAYDPQPDRAVQLDQAGADRFEWLPGERARLISLGQKVPGMLVDATDLEHVERTELSADLRPCGASPDGSRVAFYSLETRHLLLADADAKPVTFTDLGALNGTPTASWSDDGRRFVVHDGERSENRIGIYDADNERLSWSPAEPGSAAHLPQAFQPGTHRWLQRTSSGLVLNDLDTGTTSALPSDLDVVMWRPQR